MRSGNGDTVQEFATHDSTIEVDADVVVKASSLCYNEIAILGFYAAMNTSFVEVEHSNAVDADIAKDFTIEVKLAWQAATYFRCAAKIAVVGLATRFTTNNPLLNNRSIASYFCRLFFAAEHVKETFLHLIGTDHNALIR